MIRAALVIAGTVAAATAVSLPSALQCPEVADAYSTTGWREYRADRLDRAQAAFHAAAVRCPDHVESRVGLGYVALRNGDLRSAGAAFDVALAAEPSHVDALVGRGLVDLRRSRFDHARASFARALALDDTRDDVRQYLRTLPEPTGPAPVRPPLPLPDTVFLSARASGDRLQVHTPGGWIDFYVRGVNLGAALPGRFPSEFPDAATYRRWIADMAQLGANTVRVYTLHPPAFYDALAAHNAAHPDRALWLLHGVWAELPPDDDYHERTWKADFFGGIEQVIDALHGRADVPPRAGHAAGHYTSDVSRWTLGLILGREWEPYSVAGFNERNPGSNAWRGRYLHIDDAPAMDAWLVEAMEYAVSYETRAYRTQRPVAYTNWPTLDPMRHPVELDAHRELTLRGMAFDRRRRAHNEDEVGVGAVHPRATSELKAGWFAAYHAYPYYPDFMLHDPVYGAAQSPYGPSAYFGYLADLKRHYQGVPLVIAEYGVPASWGVAHLNPQGWHHGGHSEAAQAQINVRLTREIAAAGMAGGVLFAWIDEWFKHTWLDAPREVPADRNRLWWNRMNPEQHYGVVAVEPVSRLGETIEARQASWDSITPLYADAAGTRIRAHADEAWLWLRVSGHAARANRLFIGFDISDAAAGALRFPGAAAPRSPVGMDYLLEIDAAEVRVRAAPGASAYQVAEVPRGAARRDVASPVRNRPPGFFVGPYTQDLRANRAAAAMDDGRFDPLLVVINRARIAADSTQYLGMGYDRGVLRAGPLPDGAWERDSRTGDIEVRIPWTLIGVTDPSSLHVAVGSSTAARVSGIRIVAAARFPAGWRSWPASGAARDVATFTWPGWDAPRFRERRRPAFDAMREVFMQLDPATSQRANNQ